MLQAKDSTRWIDHPFFDYRRSKKASHSLNFSQNSIDVSIATELRKKLLVILYILLRSAKF